MPIKSLEDHAKMSWFLLKQLIKASFAPNKRYLEIRVVLSKWEGITWPILFFAQTQGGTLLFYCIYLIHASPLPIQSQFVVVSFSGLFELFPYNTSRRFVDPPEPPPLFFLQEI